MVSPMIMWNIWMARNRCNFDDAPMLSTTILDAIRADVLLLHNAAKVVHTSSIVDIDLLSWVGISPLAEKASMHILLRWIASPPSGAKLYTDEPSIGNSGHAGDSGTIRNCYGKLFLAYANYYGIKASFEAEALVLLDGLGLCKREHIEHVCVEVDSLVILI